MKTEKANPLKGRKILVAASGSIAAVKTPLLVSSLIKAGAEVRCIITNSAAELISPVALATLSRHRCYLDKDQWDPKESRPLHIALAEWAEIVVVAPLTASTIARWSQGLAEGLVCSVLIACERPVVAAAAMNTAMWANPFVKRNWQTLQADPRILALEPSKGLLACDRLGDGRMVDPELIELAIESALIQSDGTGHLKRDWEGKSLLASAGPTIEAFDPARLITNQSSGRMGVLLAQAAKLRGGKVALVHGPLNLPESWLEGLEDHPVVSAEQMRMVMTQLQPSADAISMASAVADLRRKGGADNKKLDKNSFLSSLCNELEHVPDLLSELVQNKPINQVLLGFAALTGDDDQLKKTGEAKRLKKGCNLLFANPIDRSEQGFGNKENGGWLLGTGGMARPMPVTSKLALAHQLLDSIQEIWAANAQAS